MGVVAPFRPERRSQPVREPASGPIRVTVPSASATGSNPMSLGFYEDTIPTAEEGLQRFEVPLRTCVPPPGYRANKGRICGGKSDEIVGTYHELMTY